MELPIYVLIWLTSQPQSKHGSMYVFADSFPLSFSGSSSPPPHPCSQTGRYTYTEVGCHPCTSRHRQTPYPTQVQPTHGELLLCARECDYLAISLVGALPFWCKDNTFLSKNSSFQQKNGRSSSGLSFLANFTGEESLPKGYIFSRSDSRCVASRELPNKS